jgi:hypothetical protein
LYRDAANGLNGLPVASFPNNKHIISASVPTFNDFSIFIVWKMDQSGIDAGSTPIAKYVTGTGTAGREWAFWWDTTLASGAGLLNTTTTQNGSTVSRSTYLFPAPTTDYVVSAVVKTGTSAPLWQDGSWDPGGAVHATLIQYNSPMSLGGTSTATNNFLHGAIAEAIVYNRGVHDAERIVTQNYLTAKWGRTLVAEDVYAGDDNATGDYDRVVIGIGQSLGTKLSTSHGSGLRLSESGSTLDTDGEFALAGHKTTTNSLTTSDIGSLSGVNQRWSRTWFVDRTGDVGTTLQFDFSDGGLGAPGSGTFSLLYSATNAFNFSVLATTSTVTNGDQVSFDLPISFADGYYTLGLATVSAHPGDFDGDGDVDGADFVAWQTNFPTATGATLAQGDADGDGDVDGADFVVWQTNFPFTPGPGTSPVPEPHSLLLAIAGGLFVARWRKLRE